MSRPAPAPVLTATRVPAAPLARSSHSLNVIDGVAYIYGGEVNPREPVDGFVHRIDLTSGAYELIEGAGDVPDPRVGHTAVSLGDSFYVFGGRGGKEMKPLAEHGAVHRFHPASRTWTRLSIPSDAPFPAARSYHCATGPGSGSGTDTTMYIHGGCGDASTGRLADVWAFDVDQSAGTGTWTRLEDAPGDPRGGAALAYARAQGQGQDGKGRLYRMGGFNGKTELGGGIDVLDLAVARGGEGESAEAGWVSVAYDTQPGLGRGEGDQAKDLPLAEAGPGARSVTALAALGGGGKLVSIMGEGKPSHTGGHDAAGKFWDDVWVCGADGRGWVKAEVQGEVEPRGWFAADVWRGHQGEGEEAVVLWGGLNGANERLADGWVLRFKE